MPRRKVEVALDGPLTTMHANATASPPIMPTFQHLNPDYAVREGLVFPELKRSSTSSVHRSQLTPLFLLREYLSRGTYGGISNHIRNVVKAENGYHFEACIDLDWQSYLITHKEVEAEK